MGKKINTNYSNNSSIKDYLEIEQIYKRKKIKVYSLLLFYIILAAITFILV